MQYYICQQHKHVLNCGSVFYRYSHISTHESHAEAVADRYQMRRAGDGRELVILYPNCGATIYADAECRKEFRP